MSSLPYLEILIMSLFPYLEVGGGGEGLRSLKRINQGHILDKFLAYPLRLPSGFV
jgi:hypothetical protein